MHLCAKGHMGRLHHYSHSACEQECTHWKVDIEVLFQKLNTKQYSVKERFAANGIQQPASAPLLNVADTSFALIVLHSMFDQKL